ncbi:ROK family transcriptional regulator [Streptomyces sp. NBC_01216]|uniref:ROK family transcriptional regulator n=1 Tax=unclassified Streptomyces TaxID=2593676 RepID=UPI002E11A49B|nr:ROK family transcriptional regulator [Streptomyces sp. NBC_01216]
MAADTSGERLGTCGPTRLRARHRALLLALLRHHGPTTRQELVRRSGLSATTVSSLAAELESQGLVTQRALAHGGPGRRPVLVSFDRSAGTALAVEVGPRHLAVAAGCRSRPVAERRVLRTSGSDARDAERLLATAEQALADFAAGPQTLLGATVVVSAAAPPDGAGRPAPRPGEDGLRPAEVARLLGDRWQIPVTVESGAALGALAEFCRGEQAGAHTILNVTCGERVELGMTIGGALHRGRTGQAGNLGHLTVCPGGRRCGCGRSGCLDAYLDGAALRRLLGRDGRAADSDPGGPPGRAGLPDLCGDPVSLLAEAVTAATLLIDPTVIVLGGAFSSPGSGLVEPLRSVLRSLPFSTAPVTCSALGRRAPLLGGVDLVLSEGGHPEPRPAPALGAAARRTIPSQTRGG